MAIFNVNGVDTDDLSEAFRLCREAWSAAKAPAVEAQKRAALAKPNNLDRERAALGVTPAVDP